MKPNKPTRPTAAPSMERQNDLQRISHLAQSGKWAEAIAATERWLKPGTRDAEFMRVRAVLEDRAQRFGLAVHWATAAEGLASHPDTLVILGRAAANAGRTDEALAHYRRILDAVPGHAGTRLLMAQALEAAVRTTEASEVLEELRRDIAGKDPALLAHVQHLTAAVMVHQKLFGEAVEVLDRDVLRPGAPEDFVRTALYLRAKACDRLGRYEDAFESAAKANAIGDPQFDPQLYHEGVQALMDHWTRASMASFPSSRSDSEVPVFIAGMPRSGTSLLDQVVDAHGQAAGVGEMAIIEHFARQLEGVWDASLPAPESFGPMRDRAFKNAAAAYVAECRKEAPGATRIVNKALGNNRIVGLLARLFPRTRVIHAIRDPRDVAVSCFMGGFNNAYYPWTARMDWIAAAWEESRRLCSHAAAIHSMRAVHG